LPYASSTLKLWFELFVVLIVLKIPVFYVGWVIWWAIKAEPELGAEGGTEGVNWRPWRPTSPATQPGRPTRGSNRRRDRVSVRAPRRQARTAEARK
jgi:hypothetical protein